MWIRLRNPLHIGRRRGRGQGFAGATGGITFTAKEWNVAKEMGNAYYLAIVRNVVLSPEVSLLRNPAAYLDAQMRSWSRIEIGWSVSQKSMRAAEHDATG